MAYTPIQPFGILPAFTGYLTHDDQTVHQLCICARCLALNIHEQKFLFTPPQRQRAVMRVEKLDAIARLLTPTSVETRISTVVSHGDVQKIVRTLLQVTSEENHITRHLGTENEAKAWGLIYPLFNRPRFLDVTPGSVAENLAFFCGSAAIEDLRFYIPTDHDGVWESVRTTDNVLAVALAAYKGNLFEPAPQHSDRAFC